MVRYIKSAMKKIVKIAIVDGQPIFRKGVADILSRPSRIIVAEGEKSSDVLHIANTKQPDIIILDLDLEGDPIATIQTLSQRASPPVIVVLTASKRERDISEALRAGALGYLSKSTSSEELIEAVEILLCKEPYISSSLASLVVTRAKGHQPFASQAVLLGLKEVDIRILRLLTKNLSNIEISRETGKSLSIVKHRVGKIMKKLGVKRRAQAALLGETLDIFRN